MRRSMCSHEAHAALKADPARVAQETVFIGAQTDRDGEVIGYLRNCKACTSTVMLTPEQHAVLSAREGTT